MLVLIFRLRSIEIGLRRERGFTSRYILFLLVVVLGIGRIYLILILKSGLCFTSVAFLSE